MKTIEITAQTTAAQLFNVKDNAAISALCGNPDELYATIEGNDDLIQAIEATADDTGALDPQEVITAINEYLKAVKAEIKAAKGSNANVTVNNRTYSFAKEQSPAKEMTRVFVMTEARNYGEIRKSRTANGSNYRPVNIGGYYLVNNSDGSISTQPDNILTNSALVSKFIKGYDINSNETMNLSGDNLAFNVVTEARIAGVTTYLETAPEAVQAAKGKDPKDVVRSTNAAGQPTILCFHSVTTEFAFRRLGTKITDSHLQMLTRNVERVSEARLKAIEATAEAKELAIVNTQKEVAAIEAKENASAKAIELKINAVVGQAAVLAEHKIDMQALLIAALTAK